MSVAQDLNKFQTLPPNRKLAVVGIVVFVFVASIMIGGMAAKNLLSGTAGIPNTAPATEEKTNLTLSPASQEVTVGIPFTFDVVLDTVPVQVADIALKFDPKMIKVDSIKNGTVFPSLFKHDILDGSLLISGSVDVNDRTNLVTGSIVTITATAKATGTTTISFDAAGTNTAMSGEPTTGNTTGATITITK